MRQRYLDSDGVLAEFAKRATAIPPLACERRSRLRWFWHAPHFYCALPRALAAYSPLKR